MIPSDAPPHRSTIVWLAVALIPACSKGAPPAADPAVRPKRGLVDYAPHLRIDWTHRRVEADGEVVLREGPLELFACSPHTREHESIVALTARPLRIFEALGMIGLKPGHPVQLNPSTQRWEPATGDPLRIEVRWPDGARSRTVDIGRWMRDIATDRPVPPGVWRFAGSIRGEQGTFLADADGTVVCVVDFASALVALPEMKSASNDALWVRADTSAIPPIGTRVTMLFTPIEPASIELCVGADGRTSFNDKPISMKKLVERIGRFERDHEPARVVIAVDPAAPATALQRIEDAVRRAARPGTTVTTVRKRQGLKVDPPASSGHSDPP